MLTAVHSAPVDAASAAAAAAAAIGYKLII